MARTTRSALALERARRRERVVELRGLRWRWDEIGADLGISPQAAAQLYDRAMAAIPVRAVEQHRQEDAHLIDEMIRGAVEDARTSTRPRDRNDARNTVFRGLERRAKMFGLDAPTKKPVGVVTSEDIEALIANMEAEARAAENADLVGAMTPDEREALRARRRSAGPPLAALPADSDVVDAEIVEG